MGKPTTSAKPMKAWHKKEKKKYRNKENKIKKDMQRKY